MIQERNGWCEVRGARVSGEYPASYWECQASIVSWHCSMWFLSWYYTLKSLHYIGILDRHSIIHAYFFILSLEPILHFFSEEIKEQYRWLKSSHNIKTGHLMVKSLGEAAFEKHVRIKAASDSEENGIYQPRANPYSNTNIKFHFLQYSHFLFPSFPCLSKVENSKKKNFFESVLFLCSHRR